MPTRPLQRDRAIEQLAEIVTMRLSSVISMSLENQAGRLEDGMLKRFARRSRSRDL